MASRTASVIKEWQKKLLVELAGRLEPFGFAYVPKSYEYHRVVNRDVTHGLHLNFATYPKEQVFSFAVNVAIRFESVEKILSAHRPPLPSGVKPRTLFHLGTELGNWSDQSRKEWEIAADTDIAHAADLAFGYFCDIAPSILDVYSNKETILTCLENEGRATMLFGIPYKRVNVMLAIAYLLDRRDRFDRALSSGKSYIMRVDARYWKFVEPVAEDLAGRFEVET